MKTTRWGNLLGMGGLVANSTRAIQSVTDKNLAQNRVFPVLPRRGRHCYRPGRRIGTIEIRHCQPVATETRMPPPAPPHHTASCRSRRPFDVITVPDFSQPARAVFEARTLVFLATWIEHAGESRGFPLHLACIHEPPKSVRRLAEACGASVTVHEPLKLRHDHHVGNKLRGLEIEPVTDRFLLLDVDVAVLSDLSPLSDLGDCVAACPDDSPNVPSRDWRRIYTAFGLPLPRPIRPLVCELDLPRRPLSMMGYEARDEQVEWMLPYYNGGVVFAPWSSRLRDVWEGTIVRIAGEFDEPSSTRKWIHHSDQAALAISLALLERDGIPFRRLPDAFNTRWQHLYAGTPEVDQIAILHCCWSFLDSIGKGPVNADTVTAAIDRFFLSKVPHRFQKLVFGDLLRLRPFEAWRRYRAGMDRATHFCRLLQGISSQRIIPPPPADLIPESRLSVAA